VSDYRYAAAADLWVQDDHVIDGRDMPDELKPDDAAPAQVVLVRDDAGQLIGAEVWEYSGAPRGWSLSRWVPVE
jgi:hypothetical protein